MTDLKCNNCGWYCEDIEAYGWYERAREAIGQQEGIHCPGCGAFLKVEGS